MRFNFQALCAALVCQSVSSFAPNAKPAFLTSSSIAKSSSTCTTSTITPTPLMLMLTTNSKTKTNHAILHMSNVMADDGEALQSLFSSHCDKDGLMTKNTLQTDISAIKELLKIGDLLQEELDDIWNAAPKFPDIDATEQRIDVDSFIQIYRDIDDIFEESDEEDDSPTVSAADVVEIALKEEEGDVDVDNGDVDDVEGEDEKELEQAFKTICDDAGLVSKQALKNWNDVKEMIQDGELGEDEFDEMWEKTAKSPGSPELIDVDGFLSFNVALDFLFEVIFDEDGGIGGAGSDAPVQIAMFYGEDLPPGVIFAEIADENVLVGMEDLRKWGDLQDMLKDGELLPLELQNIYEAIPKAEGSDDKLNEEGFTSLCETIDALFEDDDADDDDDDDNVEDVANAEPEPEVVAAPRANVTKDKLLSYFAELASDTDRLPCGLEGTETEVEVLLDLTNELDNEPTNKVRLEADIVGTDIAGDWKLLYTTSSTLKHNKSLTGLVPPNGQFAGLIQKLTASKYLADAEYIEQYIVGPVSFEVQVTGDWELRNNVSLFTGRKSVCLDVVPDRVNYGLNISTKADHWKSLGPMNLLDVSYLDDNLRIMRGTTATECIFVFQKV